MDASSLYPKARNLLSTALDLNGRGQLPEESRITCTYLYHVLYLEIYPMLVFGQTYRDSGRVFWST